MIFPNRREAGLILGMAAAKLGLPEPVVLGIPRGGVIVAAPVAAELEAPLDIIAPAKLRAPGQPELAIGAVGPDSEPFVDRLVVNALRVGEEYLAREIAQRSQEVRRRMESYRGGAPPAELKGRSVFIVDDGLATGSTAIAAVRSVRRQGPAHLVLAVPVGSPMSVARLLAEADRVLCLEAPEHFMAVGEWYEDFRQVRDEEVRQTLKEGVR